MTGSGSSSATTARLTLSRRLPGRRAKRGTASRADGVPGAVARLPCRCPGGRARRRSPPGRRGGAGPWPAPAPQPDVRRQGAAAAGRSLACLGPVRAERGCRHDGRGVTRTGRHAGSPDRAGQPPVGRRGARARRGRARRLAARAWSRPPPVVVGTDGSAGSARPGTKFPGRHAMPAPAPPARTQLCLFRVSSRPAARYSPRIPRKPLRVPAAARAGQGGWRS
jgi:hypothetical protein